MDLKASRKRQLAAAVTLAVMGMAWVSVPQQVWADSAQIGSETAPVTWEYYNTDPKSEVSDNRNDKSGANVFAAQYHQNFNDNTWAAFGDMGGKTLTIGSMTIEAIQGKDGVGSAAGDTVKEGSFGQDGGMASAQGIYSTSISNAVIAMNGDVKIEALGGKTYSEALIGSVYQHQGEKGNDGATDGKLNGGEGAKGGTGGKAVAAGVEIGNGSSVRITGGSLTVSAIGEAGGHGGYGGEGGIGATGADGAIGTSFNQEYLDTKTAQGTDQTVGQANENGHNGKAGAIGGTATAGLTGGTGGNGADGGTGGMAEANGLKIKNITNSSIVLNGLQVTAVAGNGSAGGQGGKGGTGGVGGNGGAGGNGSFGEKGGALGLDDLTATNDGVATSVSTAFPGTPVTGDNVTVTTTTTQHQLLAGKTYGGAGGAGGAGATGAIGGVGGQGGNGGNGGSGGFAKAVGFTGSGIKMDVQLGAVEVAATGGNGAKGGLGGNGGDGGVGGNGGQGGQAGQAGSDYIVSGNQNIVGQTDQTYRYQQTGTDPITSQPVYGWVAISGVTDHGTNVTDQKTTVSESTRTEVNDAKGGQGGTGGQGGAGGAAGTNGTSSNGGSATSMGLSFSDGSLVNLNVTAIKATATAGNGVVKIEASGTDKTDGAPGTDADPVTDINGTTGGAGGTGGNGSTLHAAIEQSFNGSSAIATALENVGSTVNVLSDADLAISALAQDGAGTNTAIAVISSENSADVYQIKGNLNVTANAIGDIDRKETIDGVEYTYDASKTNTTSEAKAFKLNENSMFIDVAGDLSIEAAAAKGEAKNFAQGMQVYNTTVGVHTTGAIDIKATADSGTWQGAQGIEGNSNDLTFVSDAGGITVTALGGNGTKFQKERSLWIYDSTVTFDAKDSDITLNGDVEVVAHYENPKESTLNLKSNTTVNSTEGMGGSSKGAMNITGTIMNLTDNLSTLTVADTTTMKTSTVYFYDDNNQADKYNTVDYRTITTKDLNASGTNELFMRTNANGVYGQSAGNDKIISTNTATGSGTYDITVFDQGMRNGYNNTAGAENKGHLQNDVSLIQNADATGTYNIKEMKYDNGIWAYEYDGKAEVGADGNLNLTNITTKACEQSSAQTAAQDANKIAAGAAVTLFGADETLMERLGDVRNSADDNNGVWAKYVGGKIKVDGLKGDNDFKYNGFAAGYDHEIGSNWRIGLAGQYAKGDTTLTNGDGEIKTSAGALYGTWTGDKGHHVDIIAKVGKVDSETSAYGGTIAQKLDGDFSSTAMSFAVEYGYRQDLNDGWFVEPMVRASYVHLGGDDYTVTTRDNTMSVTNDAMNSIVLRGGFLLGRTFAEASNVYLKAAVLHDFDGDINTKVSADGRTASYSDSIGGTAIEYGIGVNHKFNKDSSMYFDVERISGGDVTKNWGVNVGFRYSF